MQTYNSQNLPLEHIVKSGRNILHYKFVIKNTQTKPANRNSSNPIDHWNDDEPATRALDEVLIEKIVKTVNKMGIPAIIDIVFENKFSSYTPSPMKIPVFPAAIEYQKDKPQFLDKYILYHDDAYAREQNAELKKSGFPFDAYQTSKINLIKEQIRRELMYKYLFEEAKIADAGQGTNGYKWLAGLNIINNHYDLDALSRRPFHIDKLYSIMPTTPDMNTTNADYSKAIREFSEQSQTKFDETIHLFSTPGTHILGLKQGKSSTEIARWAKFEELLADQIMNQDYFNLAMARYQTTVPNEKRKQTQPGDPQ